MKTSEAVSYFRTQVALAEALGMNQSSVSTWGEYPPALRQLQIEAATRGDLVAEPDCDKFRVPAKAA